MVTKAHLILGRLGLALTAVVWLSLALIDVFEEDKPFGDAVLGIGLALLWILLVAGPYVIYLRYMNAPVPTVLTGIVLNAVMISMQLFAILYKDGQARFVLIWAIVAGYVAVGAGVLLDNFALGYRQGKTRTN